MENTQMRSTKVQQTVHYYNLYKKVRSWLLAEIHLIVYPIGELLEEKALAVLDGDFYFMDLMTIVIMLSWVING